MPIGLEPADLISLLTLVLGLVGAVFALIVARRAAHDARQAEGTIRKLRTRERRLEFLAEHPEAYTDEDRDLGRRAPLDR